MPILEVRVVGDVSVDVARGLARRIADAAAGVLGSPPRGTWVTVEAIPEDDYAENGGVAAGVEPVLVRVLLRDGPPAEGLEAQAEALTRAIAGCCGRPADNVHIIYEPAARGRVAFGGRLV
ncbi:MAG TPA: hypothetical protein VL172_17320 [Kofleriaceae bacterium]|nr:hypothetical protein [Kofleriaceae bacterium]